ncbi:hypothetical protein ACVXHA_21215 [Escherichia coli]
MSLAAVKSPTHLLPGQAVNLRTSTRCDVAQLEHVVAMAGDWASTTFFLPR